jgi:hypothetical protein
MGSISQDEKRKRQAGKYRYLAVNLGDAIESGEINGVVSIRVPTTMSADDQQLLCTGLDKWIAENFPEMAEINPKGFPND